MWRIPVLRPSFPLFFQHGQPEGLRWGRAIVLFWLGSFCWEAALFHRGFYCSSTNSSSSDDGLFACSCAGDVRAGSSGLGPVWAFVVGAPGQCASSYRPPGWPPSSSSPSGALRGLPGPCRSWTLYPPRAYHAACRCGPSPCVGDGDEDRNPPSHAIPQVRGLILGTPGTGPKPQDSDASSRFVLYGSITLGVARTGFAAATSMLRAFEPASLPAAPTGPQGPPGRFAGPFPGGSSPVPPPTFPALDPNMHSSTHTPTPALSQIFSGCHAPFYPNHRNTCAIVLLQCELCQSHDDAAGYRDHFPGSYPGDDPRVEGRVHGRHEILLATICRWRSTSANSGSHCSFCEHGPRLAAAAESLWRPRGVTGSA